jgi:hypothetical protein
MGGVSVDDGLYDAGEQRTVGGELREVLVNFLKSPLVISSPHPRRAIRGAFQETGDSNMLGGCVPFALSRLDRSIFALSHRIANAKYMVAQHGCRTGVKP